MTTATEKKTLEFVEVAEQDESKYGFPRLWVGVQAEYGHEALAQWLKDQNAPKEIQDLAEGLQGIVMMLEEDGQNIPEHYNDCIASNLAAIARGMHFLGASIDTPSGRQLA